jgi:hypothetical protein
VVTGWKALPVQASTWFAKLMERLRKCVWHIPNLPSDIVYGRRNLIVPASFFEKECANSFLFITFAAPISNMENTK